MKRLYYALFHAIHGLTSAWGSEAAFRLEVVLACIMVPAAFFLAPDKVSLLFMIGSVLLVLALELLNSAIEATVNRIGTEIHPISKKAKDTASAAILIALLNAGIVWGVVLFL